VKKENKEKVQTEEEREKNTDKLDKNIYQIQLKSSVRWRCTPKHFIGWRGGGL
jgi:hypothetical protein